MSEETIINTKPDKTLNYVIISQVVKNFIFITLLLFTLQPIIFILLTSVFEMKIIDFVNLSRVDKYFWMYTCYMGLGIKICSLAIIVFSIVYFSLQRAIKSARKLVGHFDIKTFAITSLKKYPEIYLFSLVLLWITISYLSFGDLAKYSGLSMSTYKGMAYYLCFLVLCLGCFQLNKKQKGLLVDGMILSSFVVGLLAILVKAIPSFSVYSYVTADAAIFSNRNYYGYFLAVSISLSTAKLFKAKKLWSQGFYAISIVTNEIALLLTLTRGAFIGAIVGIVFSLVFFAIKEKKFNWMFVIIPAILFTTFLITEITGFTQFTDRILLMFRDASVAVDASNHSQDELDKLGSSRVEIWRNIVGQIESSPIIGVGIGNTMNPHNEFLQVAAWSGVPAAIFYILAIIALYVKSFVLRSRLTDTQIAALSGAIGYIFSSVFGNGFLQTIPTYILVLALSLNINSDESMIEQPVVVDSTTTDIPSATEESVAQVPTNSI